MSPFALSRLRRGDVFFEDFGKLGRFTFLILDSRPDPRTSRWYVEWISTSASRGLMCPDHYLGSREESFATGAATFLCRGAA